MLLVLNHKSNLTYDEVINYHHDLLKLSLFDHQLIVCPSYCYLPFFDDVTLGSQDVSEFPFGAYTGQVSASALKSLHVNYVIINHSERLQYCHESLKTAKKKIEMVLEQKMTPIICIGDTKEEHDQNLYLQRLEEQLDYLVQDLKGDEFIVAYEPIYAIGTGDIPKNEDIKKIAKMIKDKYQVRVLYGGSVNQDNAALLSQIEELDGFLLGGISLKLDKLQELIKKLS